MYKTNHTDISRLRTFVNKCLRRILGICWPDTISNYDLWHSTSLRPIASDIKNRKWHWIGHTLRREPTNITRQSLSWNPQGSRRVGRPKNTWRRSVESELREEGKSWNDIQQLGQNRTRFRCFVEALCSS